MTEANPDLIKFIKEARRRGFQDYDIRIPLLKNRWPPVEIEKAFAYINSQEQKQSKISGNKMRLVINLDKKVYSIVDKRAKKNLLSAEEQIEDIVRRSASTTKVKHMDNEKLDDLLVSVFSRKRR